MPTKTKTEPVSNAQNNTSIDFEDFGTEDLASYATGKDGTGLLYPALQASMGAMTPLPPAAVKAMPEDSYIRLDDGQCFPVPRLCLSEAAYDILTDEAKQFFPEEGEGRFKKAVAKLFYPVEGLRFVVLWEPMLFKHNKDTSVTSKVEKGDSLNGKPYVSQKKLHLAVLTPNDDFIRDAEGKILPFSLNLKSLKTQLVDVYNKDDKTGTIVGLNNSLLEHFKVKGRKWMTHIVSIVIDVVPKTFTSSDGEESSTSTNFVLRGKAKPLNPALRDEVNNFINEPAMKELAANQFGLNISAAMLDEAGLTELYDEAITKIQNLKDLEALRQLINKRGSSKDQVKLLNESLDDFAKSLEAQALEDGIPF